MAYAYAWLFTSSGGWGDLTRLAHAMAGLILGGGLGAVIYEAYAMFTQNRSGRLWAFFSIVILIGAWAMLLWYLRK